MGFVTAHAIQTLGVPTQMLGLEPAAVLVMALETESGGWRSQESRTLAPMRQMAIEAAVLDGSMD